MLTISVEGNIGSGKTTLLQNFIATLSNDDLDCLYHIEEEDILSWQNYDVMQSGERVDLLQLMYTEPDKYTFLVQIALLIFQVKRRFKRPKTTDGGPTTICERCPLASTNIFIPALYKSNKLTKLEASVATEAASWSLQTQPVDLCIYLRVDPQACLERVKLRNRDGETKISIEYLKLLHDLHEKWFKPALNCGEQAIASLPDSNVQLVYIDGLQGEADILRDFMKVVFEFVVKCKTDPPRFTFNPSKAKSNNIDFMSSVAAVVASGKKGEVPDILWDILKSKKETFSQMGLNLEPNFVSQISDSI